MASEYKELLLDIAREIKPEELEEMKFLCDDFLPDMKPEALYKKEVLNFFRGLQNKNKLGVDNLDWLKYLLKQVNRSDLYSRLEDFQSLKDKSKTDSTLRPSSGHGSIACSLLENETSLVSRPKGDTKDSYNESPAFLEEVSSARGDDAAKVSSARGDDAAKIRKREKKKKYKEKKKAAKCNSNEQDLHSSTELSIAVEQENPEKTKQKCPVSRSEQEDPDEKRDQEVPGERIQEYLKNGEEEEEFSGKIKQEHPVEPNYSEMKKEEIPDNELRGRSATNEQGHLLKDKPEIPGKVKQEISKKDNEGHSIKNEEGLPRKGIVNKLDLPSSKEKQAQKITLTSKTDLTEEKMVTANKASNDDNSLKKMCILTLCTKWQSWGESIPVLNRELCLALARAGHRVACMVLESSDLDKAEAIKGNVELIQCCDKPGIKKDDPQLLHHDQPVLFIPNLVIGHGKLTGTAAVLYAEKFSCPRLHVIHDLPMECIKYDEVVNQQCNEEELAKSADFVAAIGTLLKEKWSSLINCEVIEIVPGLPDLDTRNSISSPHAPRCFVPAKFCSPIASGLKIAITAVNNSSKREVRPRRSTIIVSNTDSSSSKKPSKVLKECDKNIVDLVERPENNNKQAYYDIRGATVFLSPARVEAFGVAALDAMAIGIPIVISAQSGLAYTIRKYFEKKFHSCIKDGGDEEEEEEDGLRWAISIDKIALCTKDAFAFADELRSEWRKKFTWDVSVEQLMNTLTKSGKLSSSSPTQLLNSVVTRHVTASCLNLVKDLNLFDKRQKSVLILSPEDPQLLQNAVHLALVHWAAVFDFDRDSTTNGYLKSCEIFLESTGKPACRMLPPLKEDLGKENLNLTLPNGIPWVLLQGLPGREIDIDANLDWIQEVFYLVKKKHPNPVTILIIWKTIRENENLCKKLCKLLTLVQASPSWKNSVNLEILSTTSDTVESRLEDVAEEWGVEIKQVDINQLCNAIYSTAIANPLYQRDPDFSLPKLNGINATGDVSYAALPSSKRWVDSVLEVLYASTGNTPEFGKDDAHHFYRGGKISWYGINMNYAVERESWEPLRKKIEVELGYPGAAFLTLFHQRGTGGTTSARKLLYDLHLRYPCVCLKTINYETFLAIQQIWEFCSLPIIILADIKEVSGSEDNDIQALFGNLSNEKVSCLILHIVHRHYKEGQRRDKGPSKIETKMLGKPLTQKERENFVDVYSLQSPSKTAELDKMSRSADEQLQIPFYYGLVAFEDQFKGLQPYVSDCLQGLDDAQRTALCFLSFAFQYAQRELPLSTLAGIFNLKPRQLHSIEDILTEDSIELLIEEEGCWRPRHCTIGKEMLIQLLTVPLKIHRDNWQRNLADKAIEFVSYMDEEITIGVLLNRISDEKTQKHFSSLVEDIPESEDVVRIFKKAIDVHPNNPFFKVHLGRYYSVKKGIDGFQEALKYTDDGILLAVGKSKNVRSQLTQMKGIVYKRQVRNKIERKADLMTIISLAEEGVKSFARAVSISSDKPEDSYIPHVRMMCDVFRYISNTYKDGGIFEYSKSPAAHPFILDEISGATSDILESVSESIYYPDLRRELFKLGIHGANAKSARNKADLIKHLQELKKTSKASTAPINRQIVLIRLEQCKEKNKSVSEIAGELNQLLDEALKYDKKIDLTMRLWVRVAPHIPVDLQTAESKIAVWCNKGKTVLSYLYRYICTCIRILEGGRDKRFEEERMIARDELFKSNRNTSRTSLRHVDRPVVFLGTAKGMGQLVTLERESVKEVRKQRSIPDNYASQLRKLTGIIIKTGKVGQIKADGLTISFRADLCQPPLVGESYLNKKVRFYLAFTYFETDAYNVKIMAD